MRKRKYSSLQRAPWSLDDDAPLPVVHNIVATSQILSSIPVLNLHAIHEILPFSFYDQRKFAAITVRLHEPDCTTLLFSSGKLVVTGCRTWYQCVYASLFIANLLRECIPGVEFRLGACDVQNMVAHAEIPVGEGYLDLHSMYSQMALNCTYQRKMFPGLIYRPEASPVVLLCFFSGKIVITGGRNMDDVYSGWSRLWPTLRRFIVLQPTPAHAMSQAKRVHLRRLPGLPVPLLLARQCPEVHERLPLERDAVARDAPGTPDALEEPARRHGAGVQVLDLLEPAKLEGLRDDLAAEGGPSLLGRGPDAAARPGEPRRPHAPLVEGELLRGGGPAELEGGVVLLGRDAQADERVVRVA
jgi:transcription initiation factor TFIID TATA-box-binding protein